MPNERERKSAALRTKSDRSSKIRISSHYAQRTITRKATTTTTITTTKNDLRRRRCSSLSRTTRSTQACSPFVTAISRPGMPRKRKVRPTSDSQTRHIATQPRTNLTPPRRRRIPTPRHRIRCTTRTDAESPRLESSFLARHSETYFVNIACGTPSPCVVVHLLVRSAEMKRGRVWRQFSITGCVFRFAKT